MWGIEFIRLLTLRTQRAVSCPVIGAALREASCLARDGVVNVEDVDRIVRNCLGLRLLLVGFFETVDLNARGGFDRHVAPLGPAYAAMNVARTTCGRRKLWPGERPITVNLRRRENAMLGSAGATAGSRARPRPASQVPDPAGRWRP